MKNILPLLGFIIIMAVTIFAAFRMGLEIGQTKQTMTEEMQRHESSELARFIKTLIQNNQQYRLEQTAYWAKLEADNRLDADAIWNAPVDLEGFRKWRDDREALYRKLGRKKFMEHTRLEIVGTTTKEK